MSLRALVAALPLLFALPAISAQRHDPRVVSLVHQVEPSRLEETVARLVSFGTRHTLSETSSPTRGIGAARKWLAAQFAATGARPFEDRFTAPASKRIPQAVELVNVGAIVPGTDPARAKEAIVVTGHYDSRASDVLDATSDAPGAVDDGSGVAMALELARLLAPERPTIAVYLVAVAGEEQGLIGSAHLAQRLKAEGVQVIAMVSVDIAGNSEGQDGVRDSGRARLFSEGVPAVESEAQRKLREALGGENDSPAREWARYVKRVGERYVDELELLSMLRRDRIARGSDHSAFSAAGFPALRLSEAREHYDRQHQNVRRDGGRQYGDDLAHFDAVYAARLCRALLAAVASLSFAPAAPREVVLGGAVSPDTRLRWTQPADPRVAEVILYRRRADGVAWQRDDSLGKGKVDRVVLANLPPDNQVFAVANADAAGNESLPIGPSSLE